MMQFSELRRRRRWRRRRRRARAPRTACGVSKVENRVSSHEREVPRGVLSSGVCMSGLGSKGGAVKPRLILFRYIRSLRLAT